MKPLPPSPTRGINLLTVLLLFGAGCAEQPAPVGPALPDSTLIELLADFHLAGARAERAGDWQVAWRDSILDRRQIDPEDFTQTLSYYATHNAAYLKIYDALLDTLNARRTPYLPPGLSRPESTRPLE